MHAQIFAQMILEEYQRREERRMTLEQRFDHFRNEFAEAMTEAAGSFIDIRQEFQGRRAMFEQLRRLVKTHITIVHANYAYYIPPEYFSVSGRRAIPN